MKQILEIEWRRKKLVAIETGLEVVVKKSFPPKIREFEAFVGSPLALKVDNMIKGAMRIKGKPNAYMYDEICTSRGEFRSDYLITVTLYQVEYKTNESD